MLAAAALRSAARTKSLLRALPAAGAVRSMAAVERPFVPEEYENKYMVKTYNTDGVRGEPNLLFTHGKGQYLYDAQGECLYMWALGCLDFAGWLTPLCMYLQAASSWTFARASPSRAWATRTQTGTRRSLMLARCVSLSQPLYVQYEGLLTHTSSV